MKAQYGADEGTGHALENALWHVALTGNVKCSRLVPSWKTWRKLVEQLSAAL